MAGTFKRYALRALFSLTNKDGSVQFAKDLVDLGVKEIISTGGTATTLRNGGLIVRGVEEVTKVAEGLDGRIKTINHRLAGGVLAMPTSLEHRDYMRRYRIRPIQIVVVNLYAFARTARAWRRKGIKAVIEAIDIGGPSAIRAAAKNFLHCIVVVDPNDYGWVIDEMTQFKEEYGYPGLYLKSRVRLMKKAFKMTAVFDRNVSSFLERHAEDIEAAHAWDFSEAYPKAA